MAPCTWQLLVWCCSCLRSVAVDSSGRRLPDGCRTQILLWFDSGYIFLSVYALVLLPEEYEKLGIFSGVEFRNLAWFDSGYIFVSLRIGLVA